MKNLKFMTFSQRKKLIVLKKKLWINLTTNLMLKEEINNLKKSNFIYAIEDSKWIFLIILVWKKIDKLCVCMVWRKIECSHKELLL